MYLQAKITPGLLHEKSFSVQLNIQDWIFFQYIWWFRRKLHVVSAGVKTIILELAGIDEIWNQNNPVIAPGWLFCFTFFVISTLLFFPSFINVFLSFLCSYVFLLQLLFLLACFSLLFFSFLFFHILLFFTLSFSFFRLFSAIILIWIKPRGDFACATPLLHKYACLYVQCLSPCSSCSTTTGNSSNCLLHTLSREIGGGRLRQNKQGE